MIKKTVTVKRDFHSLTNMFYKLLTSRSKQGCRITSHLYCHVMIILQENPALYFTTTYDGINKFVYRCSQIIGLPSDHKEPFRILYYYYYGRFN